MSNQKAQIRTKSSLCLKSCIYHLGSWPKLEAFSEVTEVLICKGVDRVKGTNSDGRVLRKPLLPFGKKRRGVELSNGSRKNKHTASLFWRSLISTNASHWLNPMRNQQRKPREAVLRVSQPSMGHRASKGRMRSGSGGANKNIQSGCIKKRIWESRPCQTLLIIKILDNVHS